MAVKTDEHFDLRRYSSAAFHKRFPFQLSARVDAIDPALDAAMRFAQQNGCVGECEFEVRLAFQEALANAVLHGCKCDRTLTIQGLIACEESRLLIVVRDPGRGFDPNCVPCPTDEQRLLEQHGRGIELMRRLMDEVYFMRGGTEVHMIKHRPPSGREHIELVDE